jgi:hypothetical protein
MVPRAGLGLGGVKKMAEPARGGADGARPEYPAEAVLDPTKRVWGDVMNAIIAGACTAGLAVTVLASRPDDDDARKQAELTRASFDCAVEIGRQWVVYEAALAEQRQRGFDEGVAACKAARCRLEVLPGGQATPGPR